MLSWKHRQKRLLGKAASKKHDLRPWKAGMWQVEMQRKDI